MHSFQGMGAVARIGQGGCVVVDLGYKILRRTFSYIMEDFAASPQKKMNAKV